STMKLKRLTSLVTEHMARTFLGYLLKSGFSLLGDGLRNALRGQNRSPLSEHDINALLAQSRDVGQVTVTPRVGHRERSHLPGPDLREELSGEEKTPVGVTAEYREQCWAAAVIRNVVVLNRCCSGNHSHGKISCAPSPSVGKVELPWVLFHVVNHLAKALPRSFTPNGKDRRAIVDSGDRSKLIRADRRVLDESKDRIWTAATEHQRVAVRLCPDDVLRTGGSSATRLQHDDHRLAEVLVRHARKRPGREIVRAASGVR